MDDRQKLLSKLPKIDSLLKSDVATRHMRLLGRSAVVDICRDAVERAKHRALEENTAPDSKQIADQVAGACKQARSNILGRVINGTGVLLHTNLGRAPLGSNLFEELARDLSGYCNLEINVLERTRSVRGPHVSHLLAQACEAEDAIVVNNNAAALFLILREFAAGREVIVSRGELVQIGGGFRVPDILRSSGASLCEVGTTNITTVDDVRGALGSNTALVLKVHQSNFRMEGFVKAPDICKLSQENLHGALLVSDLGSGNFDRSANSISFKEPTPADMLNDGADLVCFSCDKMLGSVQGGVIAGRADLIERLRKNPVMRVVRVDKITYAALQIALRYHLSGERGKVRLWTMAMAGKEELQGRVKSFISEHGLDSKQFTMVDSQSTFGGGSTPGSEIPSAGIRIDMVITPDEIARFFQEREPPVVGTVKEGYFQIDFRTILPEDEAILADACKALI